MKNLILILIILGLASYYCYDKYYPKTKKAENSLVENYQDSNKRLRILSLEKKAKELFPTKEYDRKKWLDGQIQAMEIIESLCLKLPSEMRKFVRTHADKKYPDDYDKQIPYVTQQTKDAAAVVYEISSAGFSPEQTSKIFASLEEVFEGNYSEQLIHTAKILDAKTEIDRASKGLSKEDVKKIFGMLKNSIVKNPQEALSEFKQQALARHNFLTRTIQPKYESIRTELQNTFSNNFIAQYEELNTRIRAAEKAENTQAVKSFYHSKSGKITPLAQEIFKKYIYITPYRERQICFVHAKVANKNIIVFSQDILIDSHDGNFSLDIDYAKIDSNSSYIANNCGAMFAFVHNDEADDPIPFISESEFNKKSSRNITVSTLERNSGLPISVEGTLINRKITLNSEVEAIDCIGLGVVIDSDTKEFLGLAFTGVGKGANFYAKYGIELFEPHPKYKMKAYDLLELEKEFIKITRGSEKLLTMDFFRPEDLRNSKSYNAKDYLKEIEIIKKRCKDVEAVSNFAFDNLYYKLLEDKNNKVAKRFEKTFTKRMNLRTFLNEYAKYANSFIMDIKTSTNYDRTEFCYLLRETASSQKNFLDKAIKSLHAAFTNPENKMGLVHSDLLLEIKDDTFVPDSKSRRASSGNANNPGSAKSPITIRMAN